MMQERNRKRSGSTKRSVLMLIVVCLAGCGRSENSSAPTPVLPAVVGSIAAPVSDANTRVAPAPSYLEPRSDSDSLVIGLDADMTSGSAQSGESIRRGVELAVLKINEEGGLLGRQVEIVVRDHRGNPDRGINNLLEFSEMRDVIAVVGGIHTPVALQELSTIHEKKLLFLVPWAAGTPVVANGYSPNFVFRVSVRDEYAGGFLVNKALERGYRRIGLLLERTGWGRSNEKAIVKALSEHNLEPADVTWLNWGEKDLSSQFERLANANAEAVLLVCNALEGVQTIRAVAKLRADQRPPIISHWGISGGRFFELSESMLGQVDLTFLQTYSFVSPRDQERGAQLFSAYQRQYPKCETPRDVFSPVGTAHAYEIVSMLAEVVRQTKSTDPQVLRDGLEALENYQGIIRDYARPFPPEMHDALTVDDFILAKYAKDGAIVPVDDAAP